MVTDLGIQKKYYETYLSHMKAAVLKKSEFWEIKDYIELPKCMEYGDWIF